MSANPIELKPCPFCGGGAEVCGTCGSYIACKDCGAEGSYKAFEDDAIAAWNTRAPEVVK